MSTVTCELCDTEQVVEPCEDYRCLNCGQLYQYDSRCYRIMLTEEQEEVLRQHRNGGIMITVDKEYLDVFKPGNLSDTILQASIPDVKQYYKQQALVQSNHYSVRRFEEFTREQIQNMTKEEAVSLITNSVYAATELMETLEAAGKLRGNGHHARQAISLKAEEEINTRWRD